MYCIPLRYPMALPLRIRIAVYTTGIGYLIKRYKRYYSNEHQ